MMNEEIKAEVLDDLLIKLEPSDEIIPEFVAVSEDLTGSSIKHEPAVADLNLVKFQPNYTIPLQNVQTGQMYISKSTMDLSIFWKAFQDKGQELQSVKMTSQNCLSTILLNAMCAGKLPVRLPSGWNAYFVGEQEDVNILIAQMCVENDLPVMKRQIIINNALQVTLFFGTQRIYNFDLFSLDIKSVGCIESIVEKFAKCGRCRGLSPDVGIERWKSVIILDDDMNKQTYRHLKCVSVSFTYLDQCSQCKYLEVRDKKFVSVRRNKYVTSSMLLNYKSWQNMRTGLVKLKNRVNRFKCENKNLKRKLRQFENLDSKRILVDLQDNGVTM